MNIANWVSLVIPVHNYGSSLPPEFTIRKQCLELAASQGGDSILERAREFYNFLTAEDVNEVE